MTSRFTYVCTTPSSIPSHKIRNDEPIPIESTCILRCPATSSAPSSHPLAPTSWTLLKGSQALVSRGIIGVISSKCPKYSRVICIVTLLRTLLAKSQEPYDRPPADGHKPTLPPVSYSLISDDPGNRNYAS